MPDVFLSYSRDDQAIARRFADGFERAGFSVWWDQTLNAGENYDDVTEKALEEARAVVVLWSKKSVASRWVRAEATQADRSGTLVPAMIEDCKRPIMFELKQTADLSRWSGDPNDRDWQAYLASVRRLVDKGGPVAGSAQSAVATPDRKRIGPVAIGVGALLLLVVGIGSWMLRTRPAPSATQAPMPAASAATGTQALVSIAVLPFVNMSSDKEQEYFSDGLSEELLNQLAQMPDLRVIGRTSSFAFKGKNEDLRHIGEVLGVNHLLEGSVRKAGNRVKITAQLIDSTDGSHLWSETYERSLDDIFAIQEEIAKTVARELQVRMGTTRAMGSGTRNVVAYDEFLAGRALLNSYRPESFAGAVEHLQRAVEQDPTYIPARLWLIDSYLRLFLADSKQRERLIRKQDDAIDEVVRLVPDSPEASLALSYRADRQRDLQVQERLARDSLRLTGSLGLLARQNYKDFLVSSGQITKALSEVEFARQSDPLNVFSRTNHLLVYEIAGDYGRADEEMRQLLQIPGGRSIQVYGTAMTRAMGQHDTAKVRATLEAVLETGSRDATLTTLLPLLDDPVRAREELRRFERQSEGAGSAVSKIRVAMWAAYFGDRDLSLRALNAELMNKGNTFNTIAFTWWRPVLRNLRGEKEFKEQLRRWGMVDYWRATGNWADFCKPVGRDDFECK